LNNHPTNLKKAWEDLELIRKTIIEDVFPVLKTQEGWIRTMIMFNEAAKQFKVITYWGPK
jgi:hypothetical protein